MVMILLLIRRSDQSPSILVNGDDSDYGSNKDPSMGKAEPQTAVDQAEYCQVIIPPSENEIKNRQRSIGIGRN